MSYQLAFWAYPDDRRSNRVADRRTYLKLIKGRRVRDVAPLNTDRVLDELAIIYGTWRRTDTYHFSHPTHGSFDVWIAGGTFVVLTFHNVKDLTVMDPAIQTMDALGVPLYDPQVNRRFPWVARAI